MRILIAEDETLIRLDLRSMLERAGFEVSAEARDGEEAVALADEVRPDLAILDVKMPKLDGIEAARKILAERPIPIVMLTAYGQKELVARAVEAGVFGYLVKPFREGDRRSPGPACRARSAARRGGIAGRGARYAQGRRARQGAPDGARAPDRAGGVRTPAPREPSVRAFDEGCRRGSHRNVRRLGLGLC
jgi:CheY-like chemotaxis protein